MQRIADFSHFPVFSGISEPDLRVVLEAIGAIYQKLEPERVILHEGEVNGNIFLLLTGEAKGCKYDLAGRELTYNRFSAGSVFGDALAVDTARTSPVTITTVTAVTLVKFRYDALFEVGNRAVLLLLRNLTKMLAAKYFSLQHRVDCLTSHSLREKILTYLEERARQQGAPKFRIPYSREQLAAYLNADRSALSRELSRMKEEGLISYQGGLFHLHQR